MKYIQNGQKLIKVVDRAKLGGAFRTSARWIVWCETTQTTLSEHATKKAAQAAYDKLK